MTRAARELFKSVLLLLSSFAAMIPAAARANDLPEPDWIPSLNVGMEAFDWKGDETVTNNVNGPVWSGESDDSIRLYLLTFGGELAAPPIKAVPGRPRFFMGGGIGLSFPTTDVTLAFGDPANRNEPERDIGAFIRRVETQVDRNCLNRPDGPTCPEVLLVDTDDRQADIDGQGSDIRVSFDTVTWYANAGVSFDVPILDSTIVQVRPSIAYRGERVKVESRLTTVTLDQYILIEPPIIDFTIHRSRPGAKNSVAHHLGPRLELAVVLSKRARPVRTTLYVEGSYMWMLTDDLETQTDPDGIATFTTKRQKEAWRGGVGFRFSWLGWPKSR